MIQVDKDEEKLLRSTIHEWQERALITPIQADTLHKDIIVRRSERQQLAQYFFIIAVSSALLAFGALFLDEKLLEHFRRTFLLSNYTIAIAAAILAAIGFWFAVYRKARISLTTYEMYLLPGALSTLVALVYMCKEIGSGNAYTLFTGLTACVFLLLTVFLRSRILWVATLAAFMGWFGAFSTVHSTGNLFLGMNFPFRFTVFGMLVFLVAQLQKRTTALASMGQLTYIAALLIFFTGLWGVSVFGNFGTLEEWRNVRQARMLPFAIVSGIVTAACLFIGIRKNDSVLRDYALLFLLLGLYTHYFEYFWDSLNKGLFFLLLAVSFGLLARWLSRNKDNKQVADPR